MSRTELLTYDLMSQLDENLQNAPDISLAILDALIRTDDSGKRSAF